MFVKPQTPIGRRHYFVRLIIGLSIVAFDAAIVLGALYEMQTTRDASIGLNELVVAGAVALSFFVAAAFLENAAAARCVDLGLSRSVYLFGSKVRRGNVLLQLIFAPGNGKRRSL